jgi:hypothetical protein
MILQTIDEATAQVIDRTTVEVLFEGTWDAADAFLREEQRNRNAARLAFLAAKGTDRTIEESEEHFRLANGVS